MPLWCLLNNRSYNMPFQLSPGVQVVEKDFSSIVPAVSSSTGAFAGPFAWGPVEDPIRITSENELVDRFGGPKDTNFASFFTAANFLSYTNSMFIARSDAANLKNATSRASSGVVSVRIVDPGQRYTTAPAVAFAAPSNTGGVPATGVVTGSIVNGLFVVSGVTVTNPGSGYTTNPRVTFIKQGVDVTNSAIEGARAFADIAPLGVKIKNIDDYIEKYPSDSGIHGEVAAKFPGDRANGLKVVLIDSGNWTAAPTEIKNLFSAAPGTSDFAKAKGISNDELHVVVLDTPRGDFSGTAGSVIEKFAFVSKLSDARSFDGSVLYWKAVINSRSRYMWVLDKPNARHFSLPADSSISGLNAIFKIDETIEIYVDSFAVGSTTIRSAQYVDLKQFVDFYNAAPAVDKSTIQFRISNTIFNNEYFTVRAAPTFEDITTGDRAGQSKFTFAVLERVDAEKLEELDERNVVFSPVFKTQWNVSSDFFVNAPFAKSFRVFKASRFEMTLSGGVSDMATTDGELQTAFLKFANSEEYDISLIPVGKVKPVVAKFVIENVAEVRKDCMVFVSPGDVNDGLREITNGDGPAAVEKILEYRNVLGISSSYAVMDSGYKYQYDRYNDVYRYVPLNGDIAGLCARTDFTADPWFSPGGFTRGQIKNLVKLAFNPSPAERDVLYPQGINPVVTFRGQGTILFGDKTLLAKPSAFDRINVRRLFIVLQKSIATAAKFQLFEFNDSFTRAQFKNLVEPFLRDVQGRRGVVDFRVKCDESNNTGEVIDRNEFVADIFIKPNRSINFITLNFVAARSSVSFEEIGG